jgi:hypothetical protein
MDSYSIEALVSITFDISLVLFLHKLGPSEGLLGCQNKASLHIV